MPPCATKPLPPPSHLHDLDPRTGEVDHEEDVEADQPGTSTVKKTAAVIVL
jgi:hypothetical protein